MRGQSNHDYRNKLLNHDVYPHGLPIALPCRRDIGKPLCLGFDDVARDRGGARVGACIAASVSSRSKNLVHSPTLHPLGTVL